MVHGWYHLVVSSNVAISVSDSPLTPKLIVLPYLNLDHRCMLFPGDDILHYLLKSNQNRGLELDHLYKHN